MKSNRSSRFLSGQSARLIADKPDAVRRRSSWQVCSGQPISGQSELTDVRERARLARQSTRAGGNRSNPAPVQLNSFPFAAAAAAATTCCPRHSSPASLLAEKYWIKSEEPPRCERAKSVHSTDSLQLAMAVSLPAAANFRRVDFIRFARARPQSWPHSANKNRGLPGPESISRLASRLTGSMACTCASRQLADCLSKAVRTTPDHQARARSQRAHQFFICLIASRRI